MPVADSFYIITVSGGTVVERDEDKVHMKDGEKDNPEQHWLVEHGDHANKVAFKNVKSGGYLRATSGSAYGKVDCGEKQWWIVEEGSSPGSYWLKCTDYDDAYLCNASGSYVNKNTVYVWPKQKNWTHALTWHFKDANAPGFKPVSAGIWRGD